MYCYHCFNQGDGRGIVSVWAPELVHNSHGAPSLPHGCKEISGVEANIAHLGKIAAFAKLNSLTYTALEWHVVSDNLAFNILNVTSADGSVNLKECMMWATNKEGQLCKWNYYGDSLAHHEQTMGMHAALQTS